MCSCASEGLLLRCRRNTLTLWEVLAGAWSPVGPDSLRVAFAAFGASRGSFEWQAEHLLLLDLLLRVLLFTQHFGFQILPTASVIVRGLKPRKRCHVVEEVFLDEVLFQIRT